MVITYFPISVGLWHGAVVPFGQVIVEQDFHGLFEVVGVFAAGGVGLVKQIDGDSQSGAGLGAFDELFGDLDGVKDDALAGPGDVREDLMFDRIVLRAVGRIVGHAQFQLQTVGQPLQVFLEQVLRGAVAATAVAQDQQALCRRMGGATVLFPPLGDAVAAEFSRVVAGVQVDVGVLLGQVVDAVRNQFSVSGAGEIVVEGFDRLLGVGLAGAMKVPQQFPLFRVDADDWLVRVLELAPQPGDVLELRVAVGMMSPRFLLPGRAAADLEPPQQPANRSTAGRCRPRRSTGAAIPATTSSSTTRRRASDHPP
jgi:hypothetical protein